ncbi:hypothetical protein HPB48_018271 [Haemaphysalis longicornis]|uniref:Uncharacterized protein n=1 Tax=Haemaphysalis longicornis TaxID=44386 RepID=A0A9J6FKK1_HAELO|nr:hypothetical protein HPB48_018271 [Haemaphysalis longicornis]
MAAGGRLQTVYGFCPDFDWWPTVFEDAFPPEMVCSACGLVCLMSGLLPCGHVLCHRCSRRCADGERCRCPLDARSHRTEDVTWAKLTTESLLDRKIRCWNAGNGCSAVGTALEILAHFNSNCQYYAVTCQRCRRSVVQKDIIDHLVSSNCGQEQPEASPTLEGVGANSMLQSLQLFDKKLTESTRLSLDALKDIQEKQKSLETSMIAVRQFSRAEIDDILGQLETRMGNMCKRKHRKSIDGML